VTGSGHTLTLVQPPDEFLMGSPPSEKDRSDDETLHPERIGRNFAISGKEVTVRHFQEFLSANPQVKHSYPQRYSPEPDGPIIAVSWYEAAQFCRWLSEKDPDIPRDQYVYPPIEEIEKSKDGVTPLKLPKNHLSLKGYRLPTEAEWEYACRAGATTSRYYGRPAALLGRYAWYQANCDERAWPVGQTRPNDLGLFDMHGNVWEWGQGIEWTYPSGLAEDKEDDSDVVDRQTRVARGGSFYVHRASVRCAFRHFYRPSDRHYSLGFRVARTHD
jgi:formylglycine-generating enzyme required for sulfatase activity